MATNITPSWSNQVHFHPWIGANYWQGKPYGGRLLALGESHYSENPDEPVNITQRLIKEMAADDWRLRFFTTVALVISGKTNIEIDRTKFWKSISFYNYVQNIVGDGPRQRPSKAMWEKSQGAFKEVLNELAPNFVIVFGNQLWEHLPDWDYGSKIRIGNMQRVPCMFTNSRNEPCYAVNVPHPAWVGFGSATNWHPIVKALLDRARGNV